jgi:hypothetical protein
MPLPAAPPRAVAPGPRRWFQAFALLAALAAAGPGALGSAGAQTGPSPVPADADHVRISFANATRGPLRDQPAFVIITGRDATGTLCHLDRSGRARACSPADNVVAWQGRTWCDYAIPLEELPYLDLDRDQTLASGRIYLSVGVPLLLRVDEATLGLVQPDPGNLTDPNRDTWFDWIELNLDGTGFHGNTTCVDQFGLSLALAVVSRSDPGHPLGPVGITTPRSELFRAFRASVPAAFRSLADPGERRIPAHGAFGAGGPAASYLQAYIDRMWRRYRTEPLVLSPAEGTFTGSVDAMDQLVFTRAEDGARCVIRGKPTTQEAFLGNGVLAQGTSLEKVLGAQLTALLNRHLLERPGAWRDPAAYYRQEPSNHYARFWHEHGLGHRAYGFAYDDVADQSSSLATGDPQEIRISVRWD